MQLTFFDTLKAEVEATHGIVPRDYQREAIDRTFDLWAGGSKGVIIRQPTGTGKTIVGTLIGDQWLKRGRDHRVMVLAHERQLIGQFADEVADVLGTRPGIEMADLTAGKKDQFVVASRQTLQQRKVETETGEKEDASRLYKFDNMRWNWLIILDEAHRWLFSLKSCKHILEWFAQNPNSRRLGLTATPERGDKRTLARVFPDVGYDYPLYDVDGGPCAVADGWAVPYDQRFVTVEGVDFTTIREVAKDFDPAALEAVLKERETMLGMVKPTVDLVGDRRTIVFNPTVNVAKWVAHTFNEFLPGMAVSLDGSAPDHVRRETYRRHQAGEFQFLSVCGLCREGYNDPGIGAVAVFRPTKARGLAEQMKGRGCRPLRGVVDSAMTRDQRLASIAGSSKPDCMIVDLVGVTGLADCATTAHILASGKPDEVIERANRNALKEDGPIDMGEQIRKAEAEIDEEREVARQKRLEYERQEKAEAERRARLKAKVTYSSRQVRQGHGASAPRRDHRGRCARMPFGKHKGQPIRDLPHGYLRWVARQDKMKWWIRDAAQRELDADTPAAPTSIDEVNALLLQECQR